MYDLLLRLSPDELMGFIISVSFILMMPVSLAVIFYFVNRVQKRTFEERRLMLERGITPPPPPAKSPWEAAEQTKQLLVQQQFEERRLMIEKGMTPPPFALAEAVLAGPIEHLRKGIMMLCVGLALGIIYFVLDPGNGLRGIAGVAAPLLFFIGAGYITYSRLAKDPESKTADR